MVKCDLSTIPRIRAMPGVLHAPGRKGLSKKDPGYMLQCTDGRQCVFQHRGWPA